VLEYQLIVTREEAVGKNVDRQTDRHVD